MQPLVGAALAGLVAAGSIVLAALVPVRHLDRNVLRLGGAVSLALVGLAVLGAPVPASAPIAAMACTLGAALAVPGLAARARRPEPGGRKAG